MDHDSSELCAFCLQSVDLSSSMRTNCGHYFHIRCLNDYRNSNNSNWKRCSLCRQEISSEDVMTLINGMHRCEICNSEFNNQNPLYNLSCGHYFHFTCIVSQVMQSSEQTCFVCRTQFPEGLVKNADYNYKIRMGFL